jgi:GGDEF domain-containing protein
VLFRRTSSTAATGHLNAVRRRIEAASVDVRIPERPRPAGQPASRTDRPTRVVERTVSVTISAGVAEPENGHADPHEVLRAAEAALGRAKEAGQNRVSI